MRRWLAHLAVLLGVAAVPAMLAHAGETTTVTQMGRAFSVRAVRIKAGEVLRFLNADEFLHQLYVRSPVFGFSSDGQEPGQSADIRFSRTGTFEVRCEIHPKMVLTVSVD